MPPLIPMEGRWYGRLVVESYSHIQNGAAHWKCVCLCGKTTVVNGKSLRNGKHTQPCGCLRTEKVIEHMHQWRVMQAAIKGTTLDTRKRKRS